MDGLPEGTRRFCDMWPTGSTTTAQNLRTSGVTSPVTASRYSPLMKRMSSMRLDFGEMPSGAAGQGYRRGLRLAAPLDRVLRGPDKYRILDLKRRRAQIRARRELGLG